MTLINDVIARLTHEFPEFQPMLEERSRNENLGELLPLVVLTDMADWAVEQPGSNLPRVTQLLATLEREYAQADEVTREIIGAGFIEQLPSQDRTRRSDRQPAGSASGRGGNVAGSVPVELPPRAFAGSVADRFPVEGQPVGEQRVEVIAGDAFRERDEVLGPDVRRADARVPRP